MLEPMQVKTFVATNGRQALDLVEHHAMHVAVLDARLADDNESSGLGAMTVMRLMGRCGAGVPPTIMDITASTPLHRLSHWPEARSASDTGRRIPVTESVGKPASGHQSRAEVTGPLVILLAPPGSDQLMHEALEWNVFSIVPEPMDVNGLLAVMARALERFYDNHWPA
jgi:CheY-like chemotaxis protein